MRLLLTLAFSFFFFSSNVFSQDLSLDYYLPKTNYDASVPLPEAVFGHQVGEWHLSHDKLIMYFRELAEASPKVTLHEYGRSHEGRPMLYLVITSQKNHRNLQSIQAEHVKLCDPAHSGKLNIGKMPVVIYQGFSIHGNEPSGGNAAPLVAYYLAAGQSDEVKKILDESVIIFDPCYNPDGFHRFSTWANMHKNQNMTPNNADREYTEAWPRGRTNHYWFDLNRDWLPGQQPESQGRIENFHAWKPNVLTDHHEMGTNATFFFMPGIQSRVNPETPKRNQELTFEIGKYHAKALDKIGSLYYTEESYDDFYYGKGSTFPDANGCIGILFEQASARGHMQDSENGLLTFPFTIRNQVRTALSTHRASIALRKELLEFQRDFFKKNVEDGKRDSRKAFIVGEKYDQSRLTKFVEMVHRQQVKMFELGKDVTVDGVEYERGKAYVIPLDQPQYRLILGMFQRQTTFTDSIFYDVSAWTLPLAFNLEYSEMGNSYSRNILGNPVREVALPYGNLSATENDYAFAFEWDEYYAPATLYHLLENDLLVKVAARPFKGLTTKGERDFTYGTVIVPTQNQPKSGKELLEILREAARLGHVEIHGLTTGLTSTGIDLGSRNMEPLKLPKVLLAVGSGVGSYDAGEIWHLLDTRYQMPVTKVDVRSISPQLLEQFNVVILPSGSYGDIQTDAIRNWVQDGGVLIACENAVRWLEGRKLATLTFKKKPEDKRIEGRGTYDKAELDKAALNLSGAIFEAELDVTHPICYGYRRAKLPIFRSSNQFIEPPENDYAMPLAFSNQPLMAGYMHEQFENVAAGSASVVVGAKGNGRVIAFQDNTNFRAFWYGTNKLLANAIFFGHTISWQTVER